MLKAIQNILEAFEFFAVGADAVAPGVEDLAQRIAYAREHARAVGRSAPLVICFAPLGFSLKRSPEDTPERFAELAGQLAQLGVTWMAFGLPAATRAAWCERVREVGAALLPGARLAEGPSR